MKSRAVRERRTRRPQQEIERTICRVISTPPEAMYDIGVGTKTEWLTLKQEYPDMALFGCEPYRPTYRQLKPKFPGTLWPIAIGPCWGYKTLYLRNPKVNPGSASLKQLPEAKPVQKVEVWTLDEFDEWAGRPNRILLWIDIEGSELEAFKSGKSLMRSGRVKWINLEVRDTAPVEGWATADEIDSFLTKLGYVFQFAYNDHKTHRDVVYKHKSEP